LALYRLIDIANSNLAIYQNRFDVMPVDAQSKVREIKSNLIPSINIGTAALSEALSDRLKNRFELCAEANSMTLDEFQKLPLDKQIELICTGMNPKSRIYGIRRVVFSNRYEDGLRLYYLSPNIGETAGNSKYGKYCIHIKMLPIDSDIALKFDSLQHYFNDKNEFDMDTCHGDLLPYLHIELLFAEKFNTQITSSDIQEIKRYIRKDSDPLEIMTIKLINAFSIEAVSISFEDYKYITELNKKILLGESIEPCEEKEIQNFMRLQRKLRRTGIKLKISEKMPEAV